MYVYYSRDREILNLDHLKAKIIKVKKKNRRRNSQGKCS